MCGICFSISKTSNESLQYYQKIHDTVLPQLERRGPDAFGTHEEAVTTASHKDKPLKLSFTGTVLHLRGTITRQPLRDKFGNVLLWNGEIFDGIEVKSCENDTQVLIEAFGSCGKVDTSLHILKTLSKIRGPWSFVYWEAQHQRVWFGRDYFGRRSLLWHLPTCANDVLTITSVAGRSSKACKKLLEWQEVPADGVYCVDLSDKHIEHPTITPNSSWCSIQKFLWGSPGLTINKENLELHCPVMVFNSVVPSEEDLGSAMESHTSTFMLPEQTNIKHKKKADCINAGLSLSCQKCDNLTNQEKSDILFLEGTSDANSSLDAIPEECKECYKTLSVNTQLQSNTPSIDSKTSGCEKAPCRPCEMSLEDLDFTEQNSSQFFHGNRLICVSSYPSKTDSCLNERTNNPLVDSQAGMHTFCNIYLEAAKKLLLVLGEAVRKRVLYLPEVNNAQDVTNSCTTCPSISRIGVLFSGGIDSMVIAALADRFLPIGEAIDLINVAFEQRRSQFMTSVKKNNRNKKHLVGKVKEANEVTRFDVPDRLTGKSGLKELQTLNPNRQWNFVEVDVTIDQLQEMRSKYITHLVYPLESVLDDSIGCALWFAARGKGILKCPDCIDNSSEDDSAICSHPAQYSCQAKVLLLGMGADEQLGGYSRHRTRFSQEGWEGLMDELQLEVKRISTRNLGRDDRCVSDHGREARFPFLDEDVVSYLNSLPVWIKTDPRLPRGTGEKILLRHAARLLGLTSSAQLPKRAIQFGSRIAKLESSGEKGSDTCSRLTTE